MIKSKKDMVKYRNEFNLTDLNSLDKIEQDILFTICSKFTAEKTLSITLTFEELRQKAYLSERKYNYTDNIGKIQSLGKKVTGMKFTVTTGNTTAVMALFPSLYANLDDEVIKIDMNPKFATYLYDIPEKIGFSLYELKQFIFLKSKYSKTLFRFLLQNFSGKWIISVKDLREILGFPPSYTAGNIVQYLKKTVPELEDTGYFRGLEIDYTTANRPGRPIKDVIFTYEVNQSKAAEAAGQTTIMDYDFSTENKTVKTVDTSDPLRPVVTEEVVKTVKKCPKCGGNLITRTANNGNNAGRRYEKCEKNDGSLLPADRACTYFNWLD